MTPAPSTAALRMRSGEVLIGFFSLFLGILESRFHAKARMARKREMSILRVIRAFA